MKNNMTEIVCILDRSGSMAGLEDDVIGGFNATVAEQKDKDGKAFISTVLFSNHSEVLHDRIPIEEVETLSSKDFRVFGCTALYDAIADAICHITNVHRYIRSEDVPEKTVFVITTDGMENASRRYSRADVKKMIERKKEEGWEFVFLAANIDADSAARDIGIAEDHALPFTTDSGGIAMCYSVVSDTISKVRRREAVSTEKWRKKNDK